MINIDWWAKLTEGQRQLLIAEPERASHALPENLGMILVARWWWYEADAQHRSAVLGGRVGQEEDSYWRTPIGHALLDWLKHYAEDAWRIGNPPLILDMPWWAALEEDDRRGLVEGRIGKPYNPTPAQRAAVSNAVAWKNPDLPPKLRADMLNSAKKPGWLFPIYPEFVAWVVEQSDPFWNPGS